MTDFSVPCGVPLRQAGGRRKEDGGRSRARHETVGRRPGGGKLRSVPVAPSARGSFARSQRYGRFSGRRPHQILICRGHREPCPLGGCRCGLRLCRGTLGCASTLAARAQQAAAAPPVSFNRDIRPDPLQQLLRLPRPRREAARDQVPLRHPGRRVRSKRGVIVPGNAAESLLIETITDPDPKRADAAARLRPRADRQADRAAAPMDRRRREVGHALGLYRRRSVPSRPAVSHAGWVRNPIDQFILARLEREGLTAVAGSRQGRRCCAASPTT